MNQQFKMMKPMIDAQMATVNAMISNLISMWDQSAVFIEGAAWLSEEGRNAFKQWVGINKRGCENLKDLINGGYCNLEKFFGSE